MYIGTCGTRWNPLREIEEGSSHTEAGLLFPLRLRKHAPDHDLSTRCRSG